MSTRETVTLLLILGVASGATSEGQMPGAASREERPRPADLAASHAAARAVFGAKRAHRQPTELVALMDSIESLRAALAEDDPSGAGQSTRRRRVRDATDDIRSARERTADALDRDMHPRDRRLLARAVAKARSLESELDEIDRRSASSRRQEYAQLARRLERRRRSRAPIPDASPLASPIRPQAIAPTFETEVRHRKDR